MLLPKLCERLELLAGEIVRLLRSNRRSCCAEHYKDLAKELAGHAARSVQSASMRNHKLKEFPLLPDNPP